MPADRNSDANIPCYEASSWQFRPSGQLSPTNLTLRPYDLSRCTTFSYKPTNRLAGEQSRVDKSICHIHLQMGYEYKF